MHSHLQQAPKALHNELSPMGDEQHSSPLLNGLMNHRPCKRGFPRTRGGHEHNASGALVKPAFQLLDSLDLIRPEAHVSRSSLWLAMHYHVFLQ
jgi:hypothetical protein